MKYNFQFKVPFEDDDESANLASAKSKMLSVLESKDISNVMKADLISDLQTRYRAYMKSVDKPPVVTAEPPPEPTVRDYYAKSKNPLFNDLYPKLKVDNKNQVVINDTPIEGSNVEKLLKYANGRIKTEPAGYEEFFNFAKNFAKIELPKAQKNTAQPSSKFTTPKNVSPKKITPKAPKIPTPKTPTPKVSTPKVPKTPTPKNLNRTIKSEPISPEVLNKMGISPKSQAYNVRDLEAEFSTPQSQNPLVFAPRKKKPTQRYSPSGQFGSGFFKPKLWRK